MTGTSVADEVSLAVRGVHQRGVSGDEHVGVFASRGAKQVSMGKARKVLTVLADADGGQGRDTALLGAGVLEGGVKVVEAHAQSSPFMHSAVSRATLTRRRRPILAIGRLPC